MRYNFASINGVTAWIDLLAFGCSVSVFLSFVLSEK
jgi:hypothetical protein